MPLNRFHQVAGDFSAGRKQQSTCAWAQDAQIKEQRNALREPWCVKATGS